MTTFGKLLETMQAHTSLWFKAYIAFLIGLLAINIGVRPEHPHFVYDALCGFWAVFGFGVGVPMIWIMKRIIQPLIIRDEDYYGDI